MRYERPELCPHTGLLLGKALLPVGVERVSLWLEVVRPREAPSMSQAPLALTPTVGYFEGQDAHVGSEGDTSITRNMHQ